MPVEKWSGRGHRGLHPPPAAAVLASIGDFMRNFHFPGRSLVYGRRAMCATSHPTASLTAVSVLKDGGNAVDAAIATAAVLAVVEPHMTGIGGDCFALIARPGLGKPVALNAAGRAPAGATAEWLAQSGLARIEPASPHSVTVPGAIDGWSRLAADYGTMELSRLLAPAIELAEQGFVVAPRVAADWGRRRRTSPTMPAAGCISSRTSGRRGRVRSCAFRRWPRRSGSSPGRAARGSTQARWPRTSWVS